MVEMRNGILYLQGRPAFGLGVSYYPSYHPQKVPVPPEGDRAGEMEEDLRDMAGAGFNIVRMAALGEVAREGGGVRAEFPFVDRLIESAERAGLASMVRLQGYSVNLSGYDDNLMLDQDGNQMPFFWGWFVRNSLNHPGILADNEAATRATAAHFGVMPAVVAYQIYNEPAYPALGFYDYNPHSVAAWRRWMAERGYASAAEAASLEPPRRRPISAAERLVWARWRLFHYGRMNDFLNDLSRMAKEAGPGPETLTCHMAWPALAGATVRGEDYFRVAEKMDVVGITHYLPCRGTSHFAASEVLDMAESAAASFGKHAWLIEYNARTDMSAEEWERETYSAVGSGYKGILYYQWRADYPYADGPEPEGFGLVFNDRRRTAKYDRAIAMNSLVASLGERLALAEKARSGVAILFSENVNAYYDALDNGDETDVARCRERSAAFMRATYADFKRVRATPDFVRASELAANPLGVRLLVVPSAEGLDAAEKDAIGDFIRSGGGVVAYRPENLGYAPWGEDQAACLDAAGALARFALRPQCRCAARGLDVKLLVGEGCAVACLVNFDADEAPIEAGEQLELFLPEAGAIRSARLLAPGREERLSISGGRDGSLSIELPRIETGAFILFETR